MKDKQFVKIALFCIIFGCCCMVGLFLMGIVRTINERIETRDCIGHMLVYIIDMFALIHSLYFCFCAGITEELKESIRLIEKTFALLLAVGVTIFYVDCIACLWGICEHNNCLKMGYIPLLIVIFFFLLFLLIRRLNKSD